MEYSLELNHFSYQKWCLGDRYIPYHRKWGSYLFLKTNKSNSKSQDQQPCVLPPKVYVKVKTLHTIIPLPCLQISIPFFPPFLNAYIALWYITQHLQNMHVKTCKYYLCCCFSISVFWLPLSTPSFWTYEALVSLDYSAWLIFLSEWTIKYSLQDSLSQKKCLWHDVNFIMSTLQYILVLS